MFYFKHALQLVSQFRKPGSLINNYISEIKQTDDASWNVCFKISSVWIEYILRIRNV